MYFNLQWYLIKIFNTILKSVSSTCVNTLDCNFLYFLKGNDFNDKDAEQIADGIRQTNTLRSLNLSQNAFQERGGEDIAGALGKASYVYNHMYMYITVIVSTSYINWCFHVI